MKKLLCLVLVGILLCGCGGKTAPVSSSSVAESSEAVSSEPAVTQSEVDAREGEIAHMEAYFQVLQQSAAVLSEMDSQTVLTALEAEDMELALMQIAEWQSALEELRGIDAPDAYAAAQNKLSEAAQVLWDYLEQLRAYAQTPAAEDETLRLERAQTLQTELETAKTKALASLEEALQIL